MITAINQVVMVQVGVHQSDTLYGAPSYEPYPDIKFEKEYTHRGGRDKNRWPFTQTPAFQAVPWEGNSGV